MSIKKPYADIVKFLEDNKEKKVSSILETVLSMCESKKQSSTVIKDANGKIIAIFCYYHKQWELVDEVQYGSKKNSTTGLNTMCKIGTSQWTKQQRDAKNAKTELLMKVANGEISPSDINKLSEDIEAQRLQINMDNAPKGYANEEDVYALISK